MTNDKNEREQNMSDVKAMLGRCAAKRLELTQEQIDVRVKNALRLAQLGRTVIEKIDAESRQTCAVEMENLGYDSMKVCGLLSGEISKYDRYVKVHDWAYDPQIEHQAQLDDVRATFSRGELPKGMSTEEIAVLMAELIALNKLHYYMDVGMDIALRNCEGEALTPDGREDGAFVRCATEIVRMLNLYDRNALPALFEGLREGQGDTEARIAMMVCALDRMGYLQSVSQAHKDSIQLSGRTKKILCGAGVLGVAGLVLFGSIPLAGKVCAGLAAAVAGLCAVSAIE